MDKPLKPKNVYVVGAHCTGKSTLIEALSQHFTPALVSEIFGPGVSVPEIMPEIARIVMEMQGFTAEDVRDPIRGCQLQLHTLWAQYQLESVFDHWIFSDRSGIDPIVYAHVFLGNDESNRLIEMAEWKFLRQRMRDGLVVVCEPSNASWLSSDSFRVALHNVEEWRSIGEAYGELLGTQGINSVSIPTDLESLEDRVQFVEGLVRSGF